MQYGLNAEQCFGMNFVVPAQISVWPGCKVSKILTGCLDKCHHLEMHLSSFYFANLTGLLMKYIARIKICFSNDCYSTERICYVVYYTNTWYQNIYNVPICLKQSIFINKNLISDYIYHTTIKLLKEIALRDINFLLRIKHKMKHFIITSVTELNNVSKILTAIDSFILCLKRFMSCRYDGLRE